MDTKEDPLEIQLPIRRLHALPFRETLPGEGKVRAIGNFLRWNSVSWCFLFAKDINEEKLLSDYLVPFFSASKVHVEPGLRELFFQTFQPRQFSPGFRFQYKEVDFKVIACHPPSGIVTKDTKVASSNFTIH